MSMAMASTDVMSFSISSNPPIQCTSIQTKEGRIVFFEEQLSSSETILKAVVDVNKLSPDERAEFSCTYISLLCKECLRQQQEMLQRLDSISDRITTLDQEVVRTSQLLDLAGQHIEESCQWAFIACLVVIVVLVIFALAVL